MRASSLVICGSLLCALYARSTSAEPAPRHPDARIFYDGRRAFERPMVRVNAFGHLRTMLVDTGAHFHVMGLMSGVLPTGVTGEAEVIGLDYAGRPFSGRRVRNPDVALPGWPSLDELWFSPWADNSYREGASRPGAVRFDGVLSPIRLAGPDRVMILDFTTGTLSSATSWDEAVSMCRAADLMLTPVFPVSADGHLVIPVVVAGHSLHMALDTGAPTSVLYIPRGPDLLDDQTRKTDRTLVIRTGALKASVAFAVTERLESESAEDIDGLLGMDVLQACVMALDRQFFAVQCLSNESTRNAGGPPLHVPPRATQADLNALRASNRGHHQLVQMGDDEINLRPRADGGYEWTGAHIAARIHGDGRLTFSGLPAAGTVYHAGMDADEERRWFEEHARSLVATLARWHQGDVIDDALKALPGHLSAILQDPRLSPAERRRILFLLWDEMAEPEEMAKPDVLDRWCAGAQARQIIDRFVQDHLPPGTPGAFTAAELAAFNRTRKNAIRFDPYAAPARPPADDD